MMRRRRGRAAHPWSPEAAQERIEKRGSAGKRRAEGAPKKKYSFKNIFLKFALIFSYVFRVQISEF